MAKKKQYRLIITILLILLAIGIIGVYIVYNFIYKTNVDLKGKNHSYLYIRTGAGYDEVLDSLYSHNIIINHLSFEQVAKKKHYPSMVHAGRYIITAGMSNNQLVNELRSGNQDPVKFTFNNVRKKEELAGKLAGKLEPDSINILKAFNNETLLEKYGFNRENIMAMFIPNTYEMNWNTSPAEFMARMAKEYKAFWSDDRKSKAKATGLSQTQVMILASIVEKETQYESDRPIIAGVYLNRLKKDMPLEADPTLVWAANDFTIKRVLNAQKQIESPYNTYKHKGLPPGPIDIPSVVSIDAVLNYDKNDYLYFCAKPDLSGASNFAKNMTDHLANARKYQQALNKLKIYK